MGKYKYLHVEIIHGQLYVYRDNCKRGGRLLKGEDIDKECAVCDNHTVYNLNDLLSEVTSE